MPKKQAIHSGTQVTLPAPSIDHVTYQQTPLHDYLHPRPAIQHAAFGHSCSDECYAHFGIIRLGTAIFAVRVQARAEVGSDILGYEPLGEAVTMWSEAIATVKRALRPTLEPVK